MTRILVVDDSAFARKVLREMLTAAGFEVLGAARDGLEALEKIAELKPDVITLDLVMPNLDGLGVLAALPAHGAPRVVVVSMAGEDTALGIAALRAGAVELVHKPTSLATERLREIAADLTRAVRAATLARVPAAAQDEPHAQKLAHRAATKDVVVVGASTGGPQALTRILRGLPGDLPVPVGIVLHLPPGYTEAFARRLDEECAVQVMEAHDGVEFVPGRVVVARAGLHLRLRRDGATVRGVLDGSPQEKPHRPSVDVLFSSAAQVFGRRTLGVVLTGMGDDGCEGSGRIHAAGGEVLTETEASCVVYGMPRCVDEAGYAAGHAAAADMARAILAHL